MFVIAAGSHPSSTTYIGAAEVPGMQIDVSQVVENLRLQRVQVVDCRQPVYYLGEKKEALYNVVNSSTVQYYDHREVLLFNATQLTQR